MVGITMVGVMNFGKLSRNAFLQYVHNKLQCKYSFNREGISIA